MRTRQLLFLFVFLMVAAEARAEFITFNYQGNPVGGLGTAITATATIDFTGAGVYQATDWSINHPLLTAQVLQTDALVSVTKQFTLNALGEVQFWSLSVNGEFYGSPEHHDLITTFYNGGSSGVDLVSLDRGPDPAPAFNCAGPLLGDALTCKWGRNLVAQGTWTRAEVPEPSSVALLVVGTLATAIMRRRSQRASTL